MPAPSALGDVLGDDPPGSVAALPQAVLDRLAEQICVARDRQRQQGDESVQVALKGVPLSVRGIVRKALLG